MGFIALIRLLALALAGWLVWRFILQRKTPLPKSKPADEVLETKMVKCAVCYTHIPRADAIAANERWYCCTEHRDQDLDET